MNTISAVILAKNEEEMIKDCLHSVSFCDEIIVIDSGSDDKTVAIARENKAKIVVDRSDNFAQKRNLGLKHVTSDWVLYIDADERIDDQLREEIQKVVFTGSDSGSFEVTRKNFYLGNNEWKHTEKILRVFNKSSLIEWKGELHESPVVKGEKGILDGFLNHYTHRTLSSMLAKTIKWSDTEAQLRYKNNHPRMTWWRFPRVILQAFYQSYIVQQGYKVGTVGVVESLYQSFSMFVTYAKLWELQQKKEL